MAVPTNTVQAVSRTNIREQVMNQIYNLDPTATPMLSSLRRGKCYNTEHKVVQDTLAAPAVNKVVQGDQPAYDTAPAVSLVSTYTQISDKAIIISDTARAVRNYGYSDELAYQLAKKVKELKLDMENQICGNYASVKATSSVAGVTGSIPTWIKTNFMSIASSGNGTAGGYNSTTKLTESFTPGTSANFTKFTEQNVRDMIVKLTEKQDMVGVSLISLSIKNRERATRILQGVAPFRADQGTKRRGLTALGAVDFYYSEAGTHRIMFNRWQPKNIAMFMNMPYWGIDYLQPFDVLPIARTGHGVRRLIKVEYSMVSKHEGASGMIIDMADGG